MGLPHTVEIDSDGFDIRVGNRGFVWSYPEYIPGQRRVIRTDIAVLYVGDEAEKQALLLSEPEVFFTTRAYDWSPLVMVRLAAIDITRLRELVTDAWHIRAPASLKANIRSSAIRTTRELLRQTGESKMGLGSPALETRQQTQRSRSRRRKVS